MAKISKRLLITTKEGQYRGRFSDFTPIDQLLDWEVCRYLLCSFYDSFMRDGLQDYLGGLTYSDPDFEEERSISFDGGLPFYEDAMFKEQIVDNKEKLGNFLEFLQGFPLIKGKFLQNKEGTVWVVPSLHEYYQDTNVDYVESLVKWAGKDVDELYLLLHDKELYQTEKSHHLVRMEDKDLSPYVLGKEMLKKQIQDSRVFVFIHLSSTDDYCKSIVHYSKLSSLSIDSILSILYNGKMVALNCALAKQLGGLMRKDQIQESLKSASGLYDFSMSFLEEN